MNVENRVVQYVSTYRQLKNGISQLSTVPQYLIQQQAVTQSHQKRYEQSTQFLNQTRKLIATRRKEIKALRGVSMSSIFAKVSGQHKKKLGNKEEELKTLLDRELKSNEGTRKIKEEYSIQLGRLQQLQAQKQQFDHFQSQIRQLLQTVFAGNIPGYPREYQLENELVQRKNRLIQLQATFRKYQTCQAYLQKAQQSLNMALNGLGTANNYATADIFMSNRGGMNTFVDVAKHQKIGNAKEHVQRANMSINQARQIIPNLPYIKSSKVGSNAGDMVLDIVFDNIFTDIMMKQKIQKMQQSVLNHRERVNQVVNWIALQVNQFHQNTAREHQLVLTTERNLIRERTIIMEQFVQKGQQQTTTNVILNNNHLPQPIHINSTTNIMSPVSNYPQTTTSQFQQQQQQQEQRRRRRIVQQQQQQQQQQQMEYSNPPSNFEYGFSNSSGGGGQQQQQEQGYTNPSAPSFNPDYNPNKKE